MTLGDWAGQGVCKVHVREFLFDATSCVIKVFTSFALGPAHFHQYTVIFSCNPYNETTEKDVNTTISHISDDHTWKLSA